MKMIALAILVMSIVAESPPLIQLFEYTHPEHHAQVTYILKVSNYMMVKQQWHRKFDETACPETSILICPPGREDNCIPGPPVDPPNVCDLPSHLVDEDCKPNGNCIDIGTCPIPICEVPVELRRVEAGIVICDIDHCKEEANKDKPECKPVDRCDLLVYANHLEECNTPPDPEVPYCIKNPKLCITVCDFMTADKTCTYEVCEVFPHLPHCNDKPDPEPCTPEESTTIGHLCCVSDDCTNPPTKCDWGYKIGKRFMKDVGDVEFKNSSTKDANGNIMISCLNEITVLYHQDLIFQCFQDGLEEGFAAIEKSKIDATIAGTKQDHDSENRSTSEDGNKIDVHLSQEKRDQLDF